MTLLVNSLFAIVARVGTQINYMPSPTLQNYIVSKCKFTPALALKWYPPGSSGSHWPSEVVLHLCSQSELGRQMHLQPSRFSFAPQEGAF